MKTIKSMMDHLYWADGRILDALEESGTKNKELLKLVRHVAVAERVWLSRLQGKGSAQYSLWEDAEDLAAIRRMFEENAEEYRVYIEGLEESGLDEMIDYANQSGDPFRTSVRDIIVAGPLAWAISPGTDQPGPSDGIGRACPSRLHHVREALTGPKITMTHGMGLVLNERETFVPISNNIHRRTNLQSLAEMAAAAGLSITRHRDAVDSPGG